MAQDALLDAVDELAFVYNRTVIPDVMPLSEAERLVERLTTNAERTVELERIDGADERIDADVRDLANQPPVIRYVNLLVRDAYDAGASDIHLESGSQPSATGSNL